MPNVAKELDVPAFPDVTDANQLFHLDLGPGQRERVYGRARGMTLRDYFAAHCFPAVLQVHVAAVAAGGQMKSYAGLAHECYRYADALLAERAKE